MNTRIWIRGANWFDELDELDDPNVCPRCSGPVLVVEDGVLECEQQCDEDETSRYPLHVESVLRDLPPQYTKLSGFGADAPRTHSGYEPLPPLRSPLNDTLARENRRAHTKGFLKGFTVGGLLIWAFWVLL